MKKLVGLTVLLAVAVLAVAAVAGDRGPQKETSTCTTNSETATLPISDTGRLDPEVMFLDGPAGITAAVYYVASGYTGTVSSAAAVDSAMLSLTSVPSMFYGDHFLVVSTTDTNYPLLTTNSISATVIGNVFD